MLHFSIRDTGVGIPLDRQQSIFEAFTQADGSTTRTYGGTGLGLTISSQLVRLMGGRIWVESEAGSGKHLPFHRELRAGEGRRRRGDPRRVDLRDVAALIVDDNATNRRLLEGMLTAGAWSRRWRPACRKRSPRCAPRSNRDGHSTWC